MKSSIARLSARSERETDRDETHRWEIVRQGRMKNMSEAGKGMETIRANTVTKAEKHVWYVCPPFA